MFGEEQKVQDQIVTHHTHARQIGEFGIPFIHHLVDKASVPHAGAGRLFDLMHFPKAMKPVNRDAKTANKSQILKIRILEHSY